jgi:hypothetical protein
MDRGASHASAQPLLTAGAGHGQALAAVGPRARFGAVALGDRGSAVPTRPYWAT